MAQTAAPGAGRGAQPARDTTAQQLQAEPATARIVGRVSAADNGRPIRGARVTLSAPQLQGGRSELTDEGGAFDFAELPTGRYTLNVSKTGFITLAYGQRRPLQPGTPLQLASGQTLKDLEIRLPRGSAIGGQVSDENGEPMPGIMVRVLRQQLVQGQRQLVPAGTGQTDDRGQYRVWGLNPGDYYVSAVAPNVVLNQGRGGRGGGPQGGRGGAGGRGAPVAVIEVEEPPVAYAPTYYPGVSSTREARPVTVGLSSEALGIDFGVLLVQMARVSGRVITQDGTVVTNGNVNLAPDDQGGGGRGGPLAGNYGGRIQNNGTFEIASVPPGQYILRARGNMGGGGRGERGGRGGNAAPGNRGAAAPPPAANTPRFASQPLFVGGNMTDVSVTLAPGATISGNVAVQASQGGAELNQVRITARPADSSIGQESTARVDRTGTFTIEGVPAGPHWFRVQAPRGLTLKTVTIGGRDAVDQPYDVHPGEKIAGMSVVLSDRVSEINGTVTDDRGTPITDYTMLAFPEEPALWGPMSRHIMTARPDQNGKFQIRGLPPGGYFLVAIDPASPGEWMDPAFLEQHRDAAGRLTLGEGDIKTQDFRVPTRQP